jgi:hypothetical protein
MDRARPVAAAVLLLLFAVFLAVAALGQDQKGKPECETPTNSLLALAQDSEFALASTDDPELAGQAFVAEKLPPTLAIFGAIPRNKCEVQNVFHVIEGTEKLHPMETDLVNILECISSLVNLLTATSNDTQTAEGFQRFLNQSHAAYIAVLGHSENGILRFPDGSSSTLTEMARQCAAQGKRCIFPGCVSDKPPGHDPGPGSPDSALCLKDPTDALRAVQKLMERQPGRISLAKLLTENLKPYPYLMRYLIDKSVGSGAVIAVTISLNVGPRTGSYGEHG